MTTRLHQDIAKSLILYKHETVIFKISIQHDINKFNSWEMIYKAWKTWYNQTKSKNWVIRTLIKSGSLEKNTFNTMDWFLTTLNLSIWKMEMCSLKWLEWFNTNFSQNGWWKFWFKKGWLRCFEFLGKGIVKERKRELCEKHNSPNWKRVVSFTMNYMIWSHKWKITAQIKVPMETFCKRK